jgi:hypothetical protein
VSYLLTVNPFPGGRREYSRERKSQAAAIALACDQHKAGECFVLLDRETGETTDCRGLHEMDASS